MDATMMNIVLLSLLAVTGTDAVSNIRGASHLEVAKVADAVTLQPAAPTGAAFDWQSLALGAGIGAIVVGAIVFAVFKFVLTPKSSEEDETGEKGAETAGLTAETAALTAVEEEEVCTAATDYQALLKILAQKVAQEVGPKVSKCAAVSSVLESRMSSFTGKAKDFLLNEMNGAAGAVLKEMDAPETMLLLDWDRSVEANFPPASILIAGVLSPTVLNLMSWHHFVQMISVGLPVMILCICAIVIDWDAPCSIPTIYEWLYTQTTLAALLFVGHGALLFKVWLGKRSIEAKALEVHEQNAAKEGGSDNMRDEFVGNTIVLQEALLIENGIRNSFWNNVVGLATFGWVISTVWNLILVVGWTFVPGVVAFHPAAAEVAKGEYCGAWMTVLVMKINVLLAVLFLFFNLATVAKWVCDCMIESQSFQKSVLDQAKAMDRAATGLPVVELMVKAFLLRGGSDTLNSRLSKIQSSKAQFEQEKADLEKKLAAVTSEIGTIATEEQSIKATAQEQGGDVAEQVSKLVGLSDEVEAWKAQGDKALEEAEEKAKAVQAATTKAIEELWEKIMEAVNAVQNSETAKALIAKAQEAEALLEAKAREAMETINDPEFLNKLNAAAEQAAAQAKDMADQAIAMAKDPEMQAKLNKMANDAMEQAQKAAEEVAAAANDPEKRKELQEKAQQAMEQAQAAAVKAAADIQDPEMQRKMKEAAQNAMDQAQAAAQGAIAAAEAKAREAMQAIQDPEFLNKLNAAAEQAAAQAKDMADQAIKMAKDPEMQAKLNQQAHAAMEQAQKAAEEVAAAANDPEKRKELQQKAQQAMEQAKAAAEKAAADIQDPEMQRKMKEAAQNAIDQAQLAAQSAIAAAQDPELAKKLKEAAEKAMEDAQALAKQAVDAANDPELKAKLEKAAKKAMEDAQAAAEKAKEAATDPELLQKIQAAAKKQAEEAKTAVQSAAGSSQ